jgi:L-asparaginase II
VESSHRGAIAVVDAHGNCGAAIGDVEAAVFPRSSVKLIQALPLVESGAAEAFGYGEEELAMACASHSGERRHVAIARRMLEKCGRTPADLECGVQMPSNLAAANALVRTGEASSPLYNTCSGKHAGFICLACHLGVDPTGYVAPNHPVQRAVAAVVAATTGISLGADVCATDGCSIPTYAVPLDRLALAFAGLITGEGQSPRRAAAARRLFDACMGDPSLVAGTGRFCTEVMAALSGRVFVKTGAEGIYCGAIPEAGLGIAVKCDDGATRAAEAMMAATLAALLPMAAAERDLFSQRLTRSIASRVGVKVGEIRPVAGLVDAIREGRSLTREDIIRSADSSIVPTARSPSGG